MDHTFVSDLKEGVAFYSLYLQFFLHILQHPKKRFMAFCSMSIFFFYIQCLHLNVHLWLLMFFIFSFFVFSAHVQRCIGGILHSICVYIFLMFALRSALVVFQTFCFCFYFSMFMLKGMFVQQNAVKLQGSIINQIMSIVYSIAFSRIPFTFIVFNAFQHLPPYVLSLIASH